jgi:hypothetical protein
MSYCGSPATTSRVAGPRSQAVGLGSTLAERERVHAVAEKCIWFVFRTSTTYLGGGDTVTVRTAAMYQLGPAAGGDFGICIGGQLRSYLAALDAATGLATAWNPTADNSVRALALQGPTIYAGGSFSNIGGQARLGLAAVDVANGLATAWSPPGLGSTQLRVKALAVSGSTVYVGGPFASVGSSSRSYVVGLLDESIVGVPVPGLQGQNTLALGTVPNSFSDATDLQFHLAREADVTLGVYDVAGREVARLADRKPFGPGPHVIRFDGRGLPAGLYVCLLRARGQTAARRIVRIP